MLEQRLGPAAVQRLALDLARLLPTATLQALVHERRGGPDTARAPASHGTQTDARRLRVVGRVWGGAAARVRAVRVDVRVGVQGACVRRRRSAPHPPQLRRHMAVHTGARPYTCDQCGRGFTQRGSMMHHKRKVCVRAPGADTVDDVLPADFWQRLVSGPELQRFLNGAM